MILTDGVVLDKGYMLEEGGNLIIPNVEEADSGVYTCEATNDVNGQVDFASAQLTVTGKSPLSRLV